MAPNPSMISPAAAAGAPGPTGEDRRILVISRIGGPPPYLGNRTRMAALLREMRRLGYEIHFAGVRMAAEEKAVTQPLVDHWVGDFESPLGPTGLAKLWAAVAYRANSLLHRLHLVHNRLDDLFCEPWLAEARALQLRGRYARVLVPYVYHSRFLEAFPASCLKILDTVDAFSLPRPRLRTGGVRRRYLRTYSPADERRGLRRAHRIIAIQEKEAAYFRQLLGPEGRVCTVGHFAEGLDEPSPPPPVPRLGCIGASGWNNRQGLHWFMGEVWPEIRKRVPEAELWVGGGMGGECAPAPGLRLLGPIPVLRDFYRDCPVLINPVRAGTGLKIKTIEALMHGRPVVTTSVGAEGLESFAGHGLFVGDSAADFANKAVALLSDLPLARLAGEAAWRRVGDYLAENRRAFAEALSN